MQQHKILTPLLVSQSITLFQAAWTGTCRPTHNRIIKRKRYRFYYLNFCLFRISKITPVLILGKPQKQFKPVCDTIRDAILTIAQKLTRVCLVYRTEPKTKKCSKTTKNQKTDMLRSIGKQPARGTVESVCTPVLVSHEFLSPRKLRFAGIM